METIVDDESILVLDPTQKERYRINREMGALKLRLTHSLNREKKLEEAVIILTRRLDQLMVVSEEMKNKVNIFETNLEQISYVSEDTKDKLSNLESIVSSDIMSIKNAFMRSMASQTELIIDVSELKKKIG